MANEIRITSFLYAANGNFKFPKTGVSGVVDQANPGGGGPGTIEIGTTAAGEDIDLSVFTAPGWGQVQNLDDTNYVEIGHWDGSSFHPFLLLNPGAPPQNIYLASTVDLRARANTAACLVRFTFLEA